MEFKIRTAGHLYFPKKSQAVVGFFSSIRTPCADQKHCGKEMSHQTAW